MWNTQRKTRTSWRSAQWCGNSSAAPNLANSEIQALPLLDNLYLYRNRPTYLHCSRPFALIGKLRSAASSLPLLGRQFSTDPCN
jgi:hypothetical protein